jgi:hypothetical protein
LNLIFVNSAHPTLWGGGEKWTVEAASWFHQRGHTVLVVGRPSSLVTKVALERGVMAEELRFGGDLDPFALLRVRRYSKHIVRDSSSLILIKRRGISVWRADYLAFR